MGNAAHHSARNMASARAALDSRRRRRYLLASTASLPVANQMLSKPFRKYLLLLSTALVASTMVPGHVTFGQTAGCTYAGIGTGTATITCDDAGNVYPTGIPVNNIDDLTMIVTGDVVITPTTGVKGISIIDAGGNSINLDIYEGAQITTSGNNASGIYVKGGIVDIDTSADITTAGASTGNGAHGIHIKAAQSVNLTSRGDILTQGNSSSGIEIFGTMGDVALRSYGDITATGDFSVGINVDVTYGDVDVQTTSDITIQNSRGIRISGVFSGGNVTLISSGTIVTLPTTATVRHGVMVNNVDGNATAEIDGAITTYGPNANGIYINAIDGNVDLTSYAAITVNGQNSHGIFIRNTGNATDTDTETVLVDVDGTITTHGNQSHGIYIADTFGNVTVTGTGDISTDGYRSHGIFIDDTSGTATVDVSGDIVVGKDYASSPSTTSDANGIRVTDTEQSVTATLESGGTIRTYGASAHGIKVGGTGDATDSDDEVVTIVNKGTIVTDGETSLGIYVYATDGNVIVRNYGSIITDGPNSVGISVNDADGSVTVNTLLGSTITTQAVGAGGIHVAYADGDVSITVAGDIATGKSFLATPATDSLAHGIYIKKAYADVEATLASSGSIKTYGANAHGIFIQDSGYATDLDTELVTVDVDGTITT
ncbi:MAG TPA: hypothetical protein VH933_14565, partial [Aestuariivirgaceae bacterium]